MFNKDQASKLRDLAEKQGVTHKDEPLTYSAIMGEKRQDPARESRSFAIKGIIIAVSGLVLLGIILGVFVLLQQNDVKYREIIKSMNQQGQMLQVQVATITEKTKQLESDLELNLNKNRELVSRLRNLDGTNTSLNNQISTLAAERKELLRQIADTRQKAKDLEDTKAAFQEEMRKNQVQLQEKVSETKEVISGLEGKIAVLDSRLAQKTRETAAAAATIKPNFANARIALINRQEEFALINKGVKSGYKKGMRLEVFNQGTFVGELVINEVRDQVSACDIVSLAGTLRLGDEVRVK